MFGALSGGHCNYKTNLDMAAGAWAASVIASVLRFHTPVGLPWTLNLFAAFAAIWLQREISYYNGKHELWYWRIGRCQLLDLLDACACAVFLQRITDLGLCL